MEKITWTEDRIREEIKRLDEKTGLDGASLRIRFFNSESILGKYYKVKNTDEWEFGFSNNYYKDPTFTTQEALDTIRHEYAHYMNHIVYGYFGHNSTWKICCNIVGASPLRLYQPWRNEYFNNKNKEEDRLNEALNTFSLQDVIVHPKYGKGTITDISDDALNRKAVVKFLDGEKTLNLLWIHNNCKRKA